MVFGSTVDLEDEDSGAQVTYPDRRRRAARSLKLGRINIGSPIARALIGEEVGDSVEVQAPGGVKHYEIVGVRYEWRLLPCGTTWHLVWRSWWAHSLWWGMLTQGWPLWRCLFAVAKLGNPAVAGPVAALPWWPSSA